MYKNIIQEDDVIIDFKNCSLKKLITCSFRYCLGRQSILVHTFVNFLQDNWEIFNEQEKEQIKREITDYKRIHGKIGNSTIDEPHWLQILEW